MHLINVKYFRFSPRSLTTHGDVFAIDGQTGDVVLLQTLDHAARSTYSLVVIAEDQGEYSTPALTALVITVIDVNDHAPQVQTTLLIHSSLHYYYYYYYYSFF